MQGKAVCGEVVVVLAAAASVQVSQIWAAAVARVPLLSPPLNWCPGLGPIAGGNPRTYFY